LIPIAKPIIEDEEKQAVLEVLNSGMLAQGQQVERFENMFAELCGVRYAIATSSGTTALHLALLANGIGTGDEVITSPFTFIASANSILFVGAKPVFADIDPITFNLDPESVKKAITPETKAIMPVHLYGLCCDMNALMGIAEEHHLLVIEDACQSHAAEFKGKKAGSFGTGAFSFYPTKNITCAEGGMITTDDDTLADECRVLRNHGMRRRYYHEKLGFNFRMTDIHAAIGVAQIKKTRDFIDARRENARYYDQNLKGVITPIAPKSYKHVYHQYTIRVPDGKRDALKEFLKQKGIGTEIYYPLPIHQQGYIQELLGSQHFPNCEKAALEVLSLPVHPSLTKDDLQLVVNTINSFMGS